MLIGDRWAVWSVIRNLHTKVLNEWKYGPRSPVSNTADSLGDFLEHGCRSISYLVAQSRFYGCQEMWLDAFRRFSQLAL